MVCLAYLCVFTKFCAAVANRLEIVLANKARWRRRHQEEDPIRRELQDLLSNPSAPNSAELQQWLDGFGQDPAQRTAATVRHWLHRWRELEHPQRRWALQ